MHSTLRPWWCLETQLTKNWPKADWPLIDSSLKIQKCCIPPVPITANMRTTNQKKNGAMHSTRRPWCGEAQLAQNSPKANWTIIYNSLKIKWWATPPVLISSICEQKKQTKKTVLCIPPFVPDDVRNLNDPELAERRLKTRGHVPEN